VDSVVRYETGVFAHGAEPSDETLRNASALSWSPLVRNTPSCRTAIPEWNAYGQAPLTWGFAVDSRGSTVTVGRRWVASGSVARPRDGPGLSPAPRQGLNLATSLNDHQWRFLEPCFTRVATIATRP
jgi:hypothetical protein